MRIQGRDGEGCREEGDKQNNSAFGESHEDGDERSEGGREERRGRGGRFIMNGHRGKQRRKLGPDL